MTRCHSPWHVLLVGGGKIALGNRGLAKGVALSHAAAIQSLGQDRVQIRAVVDPNAGVASSVAELGAAYHGKLEDVPVSSGQSEIVVICTPVHSRFEVLQRALDRKPAAIIVEKPLAGSLEEAVRIVQEAERADCPVLVNYNRRFDRRLIRERPTEPDQWLCGQLNYGRGLYHYASHAIDLMLHWFGPVASVLWLPGAANETSADPSWSFVLNFENGFTFQASGLDDLPYDLFDIDLLGPNGRLRLIAGGASIQREGICENAYYNGYRHLMQSRVDTGTVGGFVELYDQLFNWLDGSIPHLPACFGREALATTAIIAAVELSRKSAGRSINPARLLDELIQQPL